MRQNGGQRRPPAQDCSSPARNPAAPPWEGWRTYEAPVTAAASRPTATMRRPERSSSRNGREASISARVGRLFELAVPGWVGTTFQQRTSSSSSMRTRWTIVAVAAVVAVCAAVCAPTAAAAPPQGFQSNAAFAASYAQRGVTSVPATTQRVSCYAPQVLYQGDRKSTRLNSSHVA